MGLRVIYVMTHDSIGLGEDGPTHQPVEHLATLRAMPNLNVFRPADAVETAEAGSCALKQRDRPSRAGACRGRTCRCCGTAHDAENLVARGAYVLREPAGDARRDAARHRLGGRDRASTAREHAGARDGIAAAVVSMPCWELFEEQDARLSHAPSSARAPRIAVEAAVAPRLGPLDRRGRRLRRHDAASAPRAPAEDLYRAFRHHRRSGRRRRPANSSR